MGSTPRAHRFPTCRVDGCPKRNKNKRDPGYCSMHYSRLLNHGDVGPARQLRRRLGTGSIKLNGYKNIMKNGITKAEHRWFMEEYLGRELLPGETVHHKNGDRVDNRLENLELWTVNQTPGQRVEDQVAWAREVLRKYGSYSPPTSF